LGIVVLVSLNGVIYENVISANPEVLGHNVKNADFKDIATWIIQAHCLILIHIHGVILIIITLWLYTMPFHFIIGHTLHPKLPMKQCERVVIVNLGVSLNADNKSQQHHFTIQVGGK
jgi:hypothetical protein